MREKIDVGRTYQSQSRVEEWMTAEKAGNRGVDVLSTPQLLQLVEDAAMQCLPFVQARVLHAQSSRTLLRASSADQSDPTLLLRAATSGIGSEPTELLRATDNQ